MNENPQITPLPHGLKTESTLSQLSPGSNRILVAMSNYSDQDITIPAKTIISQLSQVPKMIYPGDDKDSELLDKDEGLKYEHFEQHKLISEELNLEPEEYIPTSCDKTCDQSHTVEVEDLGPDLEEDYESQNSYTEYDKPDLDSLVDTNEFLEFVDTLDTGEQTADIVPKSVTESQFSSVMSYHEGDSTTLMDPSTDSQELSKSLDAESAEELASGTVDHKDSGSHDIDVFASDTEESSLQSIQNDSSVQPTDSNVTQSVVEDEPENVVSVEIAEPRRSGRARKQTALYGNPLLYTITYKLAPRFVPAFFKKCLKLWNHYIIITLRTLLVMIILNISLLYIFLLFSWNLRTNSFFWGRVYIDMYDDMICCDMIYYAMI